MAEPRRPLRVFPRRTKATPDDDGVRIGGPQLWDTPETVLSVAVSVTFTWDIPKAERLARTWSRIAPTELGGPALGDPGDTFVPGTFLRSGYTITSRGCPNRCWFCDASRREGREIRELPIFPGWNVLDSNLLACSDLHVRRVFGMLSKQSRRAQFTGGLEAARLEAWHVDELSKMRPRPAIFLAYDTPEDYEPLVVAARELLRAGFTTASHRLRCYVLCGYPGDSLAAAETRLRQVLELGLTPMAMVWRNKAGERAPEWLPFQKAWSRPAIIHAKARP